MKITKQLYLLAFLAMYMSSNSIAAVERVNSFKSKFYSKGFFISMPADDPNLQFTVIKNDWEINVHVSFNGNEGANGTLKIYNASNQLVSEFAINLVSSPGFATINLNEWSSGIYSVELTTASGVHTSHFTI